MKPIYLEDAIKMLGVTKQTIYNYVSKGFLIKHKNPVTGKIYFIDADLKDLKSIIDGKSLPFTGM